MLTESASEHLQSFIAQLQVQSLGAQGMPEVMAVQTRKSIEPASNLAARSPFRRRGMCDRTFLLQDFVHRIPGTLSNSLIFPSNEVRAEMPRLRQLSLRQ